MKMKDVLAEAVGKFNVLPFLLADAFGSSCWVVNVDDNRGNGSLGVDVSFTKLLATNLYAVKIAFEVTPDGRIDRTRGVSSCLYKTEANGSPCLASRIIDSVSAEDLEGYSQFQLKQLFKVEMTWLITKHISSLGLPFPSASEPARQIVDSLWEICEEVGC